MRRSGLITGIGLLLLLGGGYVLVLREDTPKESEIVAEDMTQEPVNEAGESIEAVLGEMPKQPDFASLTETIFLSEGVAEAKSFETRAITPLESLWRMARETQTLLEKQEANWCEPVSIFSQFESVTNDMYREILTDERAIRDSSSYSPLAQVEEIWNMWLLRMTEAAQRDGKKASKKVDNFQDSFNDISDEFEATLDQSIKETRDKMDGIIFVEPDSLSLPHRLLREIQQALAFEVNACKAGQVLTPVQSTSVSRALTLGEKKLDRALATRKSRMNQVLDAPAASLSALGSKTKDLTARFEAASIELQQALP